MMVTLEHEGALIVLRPATAEDDLYAPHLHVALLQQLHPAIDIAKLPTAAFAPVVAFVQIVQQCVKADGLPFPWPNRFSPLDELLRAYRWLLTEPAQRTLAAAWVDAVQRANAAPGEADPK